MPTPFIFDPPPPNYVLQSIQTPLPTTIIERRWNTSKWLLGNSDFKVWCNVKLILNVIDQPDQLICQVFWATNKFKKQNHYSRK